MFKNLKRRIAVIAVPFIGFLVPIVHATDTSMTDTITEVIPFFISFAVMGALMGMLKKFGKW